MLTKDNYFSLENQLKYMGVSQFKEFMKCPASALATIKGEYERKKTVALLVGSYVDSYFEGSLDSFKLNNPEIFKKDGSLKSQFEQAERIIERVKRDKMFMDFMSGEPQVIMTGNIAGVDVKIKIDSYHKDKIVDLKIVKDFEPIYVKEKGKMLWFEAWGYDLQGGVYREVVRQNTGKKLPFYLASATKEDVTDLDIIEIEDDLLDFELEQFKKYAPLFDAIKQGLIEPERCESCDYCKQTKILKNIKKSGDFIYE